MTRFKIGEVVLFYKSDGEIVECTVSRIAQNYAGKTLYEISYDGTTLWVYEDKLCFIKC